MKTITGSVFVLILASVTGCGHRSLARNGPTGVWIAGGSGAATGNVKEQGAFMAQVVYQPAHHYLTLRANALLDPFGTSAEAAFELGLLYGRAITHPFVHAGAAAGLSYTVIDGCRTPAPLRCTTAGVPLIAEIALRPAPIIGIGAQAFANINPHRSWYGALVFVQLGWMPGR